MPQDKRAVTSASAPSRLLGAFLPSQNFANDQYGSMWLSSFAGIVTPNLTPSLKSKINASTNQVSLSSGTAYDLNGNLTTYGSSSLTYDTNNRMVSVVGTAAYAYDGVGQRVSKVAGGVTAVYVYMPSRTKPPSQFGCREPARLRDLLFEFEHLGCTRLSPIKTRHQWPGTTSCHCYL